MATAESQDSTELDQPSAPQSDRDLGLWIERLVVGSLFFLGQVIRTWLWMTFRPWKFAQRVRQPDATFAFGYPITFLVLGILVGFTLLTDVWTVSESTRQLFNGSEMGWINALVQTFVNEIQSMNASEFVLRTLPAALITLALAAAIGWFCGDFKQNFRSPLVSAICLVLGYKLFLRFIQAIWQITNVWLSESGSLEWLGAGRLQKLLQGMWIAYFLFMAYIILWAGLPMMVAVLRQTFQNRWLRAWPASTCLAVLLSGGLFVGIYMAPLVVWNSFQIAKLSRDNHLIEVVPISNAELRFVAGDATYLSAQALVRSNASEPVVLALPSQWQWLETTTPVEFHVESEGEFDEATIIQPGDSLIVRGVWKLQPEHVAQALQQASIPLAIQLGTVDQFMVHQVQSTSLQIKTGPQLAQQLSRYPSVAEAVHRINALR